MLLLKKLLFLTLSLCFLTVAYCDSIQGVNMAQQMQAADAVQNQNTVQYQQQMQKEQAALHEQQVQQAQQQAQQAQTYQQQMRDQQMKQEAQDKMNQQASMQQAQMKQEAMQAQQAQQMSQIDNWVHNGELAISQNKTQSWEDKGVIYSVYDVVIKNCGDKTLHDVTIVAEGNCHISKPSDIWSVEKLTVGENRYHFPAYLCQNGLGAGSTFSFGYINKDANPIQFSFCEHKW